MIVIALAAVAYRVHDPKWSFAPTSGAGAGKHGGRANRPGVDALYLSLELETALSEYKQLDALAGTDAIQVHDPDHALPRNQASWE